MALDRREKYELVQALLRVRNRKDGGDILENIVQAGTAPSDGRYAEPRSGGTNFFPASQPGVTTDDNVARQAHKLIPTPRPHPFRDLARISYAGEAAGMAKSRSTPVHNQHAFRAAPSTLSRLTDLQARYRQPVRT